jgi:hypothetical protein
MPKCEKRFRLVWQISKRKLDLAAGYDVDNGACTPRVKTCRSPEFYPEPNSPQFRRFRDHLFISEDCFRREQIGDPVRSLERIWAFTNRAKRVAWQSQRVKAMAFFAHGGTI